MIMLYYNVMNNSPSRTYIRRAFTLDAPGAYIYLLHLYIFADLPYTFARLLKNWKWSQPEKFFTNTMTEILHSTILEHLEHNRITSQLRDSMKDQKHIPFSKLGDIFSVVIVTNWMFINLILYLCKKICNHTVIIEIWWKRYAYSIWQYLWPDCAQTRSGTTNHIASYKG